MKEFDFMQARKELQEKLGEFYIVTVVFTEKKRLSIRGTTAVLDMMCVECVYNFCTYHNLKYYVYITPGHYPAFDIFQ